MHNDLTPTKTFNFTNKMVHRFRPAWRWMSPRCKNGFLYRDRNSKCQILGHLWICKQTMYTENMANKHQFTNT